jgi:hypothetical protein
VQGGTSDALEVVPPPDVVPTEAAHETEDPPLLPEQVQVQGPLPEMAEAVPAAQRFIAPVGLELKPKPLSAPQTPLAKQAEVVHPVVQTDPKAPERLPELHENVALPTEGEAPTTVRLLPSAIVVLPAAVHVFAPTVHTTVPGRTHDVEALVVAMAF